jgi:hypothetical protein
LKRLVFAEPAEHDLNAIIADTVTILAVFHTSRDLARALAERGPERMRRGRSRSRKTPAQAGCLLACGERRASAFGD